MGMPELSLTLPVCVNPRMVLDFLVTKRGVCLVGYWLCVLCCLSVVGFAWLVMWCLSVTEPSNVISILISSEFLKMDTLVSVVTCDARCGDGLQAFCFPDVKNELICGVETTYSQEYLIAKTKPQSSPKSTNSLQICLCFRTDNW